MTYVDSVAIARGSDTQKDADSSFHFPLSVSSSSSSSFLAFGSIRR